MPQDTKQLKMQRLRTRAADEINLKGETDSIVWGVGSLDAAIALVGESPGRQEASSGVPFVGPAGKLLRDTLESMGVRLENVYITNVVKRRLTQPGGKRNRPPTEQDIQNWLPYLSEELAIVEPLIIVCLGSVAARALLGNHFKMSQDRGEWRTSSIGVRAIATYHPSYVMRFGALQSGKRNAFRDDLAIAHREAAKALAQKRQDEVSR